MYETYKMYKTRKSLQLQTSPSFFICHPRLDRGSSVFVFLHFLSPRRGRGQGEVQTGHIVYILNRGHGLHW